MDSDLYRKHPDWTIEIPGKPHAEGRNQRILDLGRREVQEYIIASMTKVFSSAPVSYVKWDMNRTFSILFTEPAGRTAGRGGTSLCAGTVPVHGGTDPSFSGNFI